MFGYRTNLLLGDGNGYVNHSQLRRQLAAVAGDVRATSHTVIEGNYSYYNLYQHGYPGWFAYSPTTTPLSVPGSKSILIAGTCAGPDSRRLRAIVLRRGSYFADRRSAGEARLQLELASGGRRRCTRLPTATSTRRSTSSSITTGITRSYLANAFLRWPRGSRWTAIWHI